MDEKANQVLASLRGAPVASVRVVRITYQGQDTFEAACSRCGGGRPHVARDGGSRECAVCGCLTPGPLAGREGEMP